MERRFFIQCLSLVLSGLLWVGLAAPAAPAIPWDLTREVELSARKEKILVIYAAGGHATKEAQLAISKQFKERQGVTIEWETMSARDTAPRILAEQRTQQYVADILFGGFGGGAYSVLNPRGFLVSILAPSTMEKNAWRLDPAALTAKDREWLFINMPLRPSFFVNTKLLRPKEQPKSYHDLLDPKWKGKIVLQTPAIGGSGSGWFQATYKSLGLDYMRALAKQVVLVRGVDDVPNAIVQGQYPIGIAATPTRVRQLKAEGAPVKLVQAKEGSHLANQGVMFIKNAPHPNAAKIFLHWFYSKEGQEIYSKHDGSIAVRKDVGQNHISPEERYVEGEPFMAMDVTDSTDERQSELFKLAAQIFGESK